MMTKMKITVFLDAPISILHRHTKCACKCKTEQTTKFCSQNTSLNSYDETILTSYSHSSGSSMVSSSLIAFSETIKYFIPKSICLPVAVGRCREIPAFTLIFNFNWYWALSGVQKHSIWSSLRLRSIRTNHFEWSLTKTYFWNRLKIGNPKSMSNNK